MNKQRSTLVSALPLPPLSLSSLWEQITTRSQTKSTVNNPLDINQLSSNLAALLAQRRKNNQNATSAAPASVDDTGYVGGHRFMLSTSLSISDDVRRRWEQLSIMDDAPVIQPSTQKASVSVAESKDAVYDWRWLLAQCELYATYGADGHAMMSATDMAQSALSLLQSNKSNDQLQSEMIDLFGLDGFELISTLLNDRAAISRIKPTTAAPTKAYNPHADRALIRSAAPALMGVSVTSESAKVAFKHSRRVERRMARQSVRESVAMSSAEKQIENEAKIDDAIAALQSWRVAAMDSPINALPLGTKRTQHKGYEEVFIPPIIPPPIDRSKLIPISKFDQFAQIAFPKTSHLNRIQTECFHAAYETNENLLICAPTGAGKTNIAMMCILHEIRQHVINGILQPNSFKCIYVAPMKALAQEVQSTFQKRLAPLGIIVKELTGDMQLTKQEIKETQIIITTPEKWDVMTRKNNDGSLLELVRLLIIDEVHLLHEERGSVIEILVARTLRQVERSQQMCRIIGLSATLPNYKDVATFLSVNATTGLFYFDASYRPVPLEQTFIGVQETNTMKRVHLMTDIAYKKALASVRAGHQCMIFVHSRRDTVQTAKQIRELASLDNNSNAFSASEHTLFDQGKYRMQRSKNTDLIELFEYGFACHHAGMIRSDRSLVESLFSDGLIKVLVCTATLAWGVNLPAHTVIIKGTQIYDAAKGGYIDIGMLDVMQIFGRAGRPQFDKSGEAIIISEHVAMIKYLRLLNNALPIESQFNLALPDHLNAEIILGTVSTLNEAIDWLGYTYLYVRMQRNPLVYGITHDELNNDYLLFNKRRDLIINSAKILMKCRMVKFDSQSGNFYTTDVGRVASHYYIHHSSIEIYNNLLKSYMTDEDILYVIANSKEFTQIKIRDDELNILEQIASKYCPIKIKGGLENTIGKANLLLQAYISRAFLETSTLISDSYFITQSAGRITRALFEIVLKKGYTFLVKKLLNFTKMIDKQIWEFQSPLRQFLPFLKLEIIYKIEEKNINLDQLIEMNSDEISFILKINKIISDQIITCISYIPYIELYATIQPITRTVLRVSLTLTPSFQWNDRWHGTVEPFYIWIEDIDNDHIYYSELFLLHKKQYKIEHKLIFTIPIYEPLPSQYIIKCISDRWLGSESSFALSFQHLILPELYPPHTQLLDLHPLPLTVLNNKAAESIYKFTHFNPIQTQIFHCVYHTDENVLLGCPTGSGKTIAAELAMLRLWSIRPGSKVVYIAPLKALARERITDWESPRSLAGKLGIKVVELTGDTAPDSRTLKSADLFICTPEKWDGITRHWQHRDYVQSVGLIVFDEIHLLGADRGPVLEVIVSRMRYMSAHTDRTVRLVGLSTALANARDLADWLGIDQVGLFNFPPSVRPVPLTVHIAGFPGVHYCPRMATMNRPTYAAIMTHSPTKPALVFVSSRRQTRLTALDLIAYSAVDGNPRKWLHMSDEQLASVLTQVGDVHLRHMLSFGIGMHHAGLSPADRTIVERLFDNRSIQVLVCTSTLAWGVNLPAHLVVIKGTEFYDAKTNRYVDFPITDVLQMMGRAGRPQYDDSGKAVVLVHEPKKSYYLNFLHSPFPVESSLHLHLHNHISAEINNGAITSIHDAIDFMTWTFFFRRLIMNPSYYGLDDASANGINEYLLNLIKGIIKDLNEAGLVTIDDEQQKLISTSLGHITSYYYLDYRTMKVFIQKLNIKSTLSDILECLAFTHEYSEIPVRHNENLMNEELAKRVRWPPVADFGNAHVKTLLLLQCVMGHEDLPISDYVTDTKTVLDQSMRILQAMVDVSAEAAWLNTTLNVCLLMQSLIQGQWWDDNALAHLPHCTSSVISALAAAGVHSLAHFICMNAVKRQSLLQSLMNERQCAELIAVLARYPSVDFHVHVSKAEANDLKDSAAADAPVKKVPTVEFAIELIRTNANENTLILSPVFHKPKHECWWLVIGRNDQLVAIKRVSAFTRKTRVKMSVAQPPRGDHQYVVFLMSDSYIGIDQQRTVIVHSDAADAVAVDIPLPDYALNTNENHHHDADGDDRYEHEADVFWSEHVIGESAAQTAKPSSAARSRKPRAPKNMTEDGECG